MWKSNLWQLTLKFPETFHKKKFNLSLPFDFFPSTQTVFFSLLALAPGIFESSSPSVKQSRFSSCNSTHIKLFLNLNYFFKIIAPGSSPWLWGGRTWWLTPGVSLGHSLMGHAAQTGTSANFPYTVHNYILIKIYFYPIKYVRRIIGHNIHHHRIPLLAGGGKVEEEEWVPKKIESFFIFFFKGIFGNVYHTSTCSTSWLSSRSSSRPGGSGSSPRDAIQGSPDFFFKKKYYTFHIYLGNNFVVLLWNSAPVSCLQAAWGCWQPTAAQPSGDSFSSSQN